MIYRLLASSLFLHFLTIGVCTAQDEKKWDGFGIETNFFAGKVIKHTPKFTLPLPKISDGLDIDLQLKTHGKKEWEQRRRYPTIGLGFTYTNYGINSIYGRAFGMYPNIIIPLVTGKNLSWTLRIGDGIGYVTRDYSRWNPVDTINDAIGSHLNDYFSFMSDLRYHISDHFDIQLGINFSHISDASFHQPNLGINLAGVHIGIRYFPVSYAPKHIVRNLKPLKNRWLAQFRLTIAKDESQAPLGPSYPVYLATVYVSKRWISKNKAFAGIDYSYHESLYAYQRYNGFGTPGTEASDAYKSAVFVGNEFLLGRLGVVFQVGYYIHQSIQVLGLYYEKIGGNFYIVQKEHGPIKELFVCAYLKTHLSVAELAEFGFGMGF